MSIKNVWLLAIIYIVFNAIFCEEIYGDTIPEPEIFQPLLIPGFPQVRDFAMSPEREEIYFSVTSYRNELSFILYISKTNNGWSEAKIASFSGQYNDIEPAFSPDGNRLYFSSQRPNSDTTSEPKDYDIWYVERGSKSNQWSEPVNLGTQVNSKENEFYPSVASSGNIYFTSKREDLKGGEDLYVCKYVDGKYLAPTNLGDSINSDKFEFNAYVSPDESFILFSSFGRDDGLGGGDIYISRRGSNGQWEKAENLGKSVNSKSLDYCPSYDSKEKILYFTSRRNKFPKYFQSSLDIKKLVEVLNQPVNGVDRIYFIDYSVVE